MKWLTGIWQDDYDPLLYFLLVVNYLNLSEYLYIELGH